MTPTRKLDRGFERFLMEQFEQDRIREAREQLISVVVTPENLVRVEMFLKSLEK